VSTPILRDSLAALGLDPEKTDKLQTIRASIKSQLETLNVSVALVITLCMVHGDNPAGSAQIAEKFGMDAKALSDLRRNLEVLIALLRKGGREDASANH
jgi:hypothetical protein